MAPLQSVLPCILVLGLFLIPCLETALTGPLKRNQRQDLDRSVIPDDKLKDCLTILFQGGECDLEVPNQPAPADCTCVKNHQCLDNPGLINIVNTRKIKCELFEKCCVNIDRTIPKPSPPTEKPRISKGKCARPVPQGNILFLFEGNQAQFGQFPWMVAVMKQGGQDIENVYAYVSGGSLIHERVVLTVAHNVKDYIGQEHVLKARLGEWDLKNDGEPTPTQDISVSKIVLHPAFDPISLNYDIAVLILAQPATFGPSVGLVCLPEPFQNFDGSLCLSSGWGTDVFGDPSRYAQILKAIDLPAVDHQECQRKLSTTRLGRGFQLHKSFMCAGGQVGKDTCTGDGGSPLVCQTIDKDGNEAFIQAGVVAWGIGCGTDIPAAYSSVSEVMPWIGEVLNEFKAPPFDVRRPSG